MRAIVVGAGGIGRAVLERLGRQWEITAVDLSQVALDALPPREGLRTRLGDGSSRLTLDRAGLNEADALVVAIRDDAVALEICRLGTSAAVPRVVAMAVDPARIAEFGKLGVTAVSPNRLAARRVEVALEPRRVETAAFADGHAEAIEFRLAPDSPMAGRTLSELSLRGWLVAAILREGTLIVPHGLTALEPGDRVTVVGPTADHSAMVRTFTRGEVRFPLAYGGRIGVALGVEDRSGVVEEAVAFVRMTAAEALTVVHPRRATLDEAAVERLDARIETLRASAPHVELVEGHGDQVGLPDLLAGRTRDHLGCVVVPRPRGLRASLASLRATGERHLPALFAAGTAGYRALVIPARDSEGAWEAAWAALDLARAGSLPIEALGATTPTFLAGADDEPEIRAAIVRLRDEGSVRGVEVTGLTVRGNPVRIFRAVDRNDLLVLGYGTIGSLLRPGFTAAVLAGLPGSLLVVPRPPGPG
jgi:Trk K+ transport system NAD-binding subunit